MRDGCEREGYGGEGRGVRGGIGRGMRGEGRVGGRIHSCRLKKTQFIPQCSLLQ